MTAINSTVRPARGRLRDWRARWFGERDHVADQLRDIARQGSSMARLAHACAFLLIVLFSAGSLVALGGDALSSILREWNAGGVDIPAAISVGVSTLMVLAMDVGMLYAASMLRLLATRRAEARERRMHMFVIVVVTVLEASTYGYMSWRYESPATWAAWTLILSRAFAAPLLSVYLSMARPLPVTSRDILYQAELAAGQGVIRDVVEVASDQGAPLAEKMALYGAAATMTEHDRGRLDNMIAAVERRSTYRGTYVGDPEPAIEEARIIDSTVEASPPRLRAVSKPRRRKRVRRATDTRTASAEERVRTVYQPGMTVSQLQAAAGLSSSAASKWRKVLLAEATQQLEEEIAS
jgi:hypothetical protein